MRKVIVEETCGTIASFLLLLRCTHSTKIPNPPVSEELPSSGQPHAAHITPRCPGGIQRHLWSRRKPAEALLNLVIS
jgi:hypothetical protein